MKTINKIEDIRYKDFKQVQDTMLELDKASTEDIAKAFKVIYNVSEEEFKNIKWKDINDKMITIVKLLSNEIELVTKFEENNIKYGFIPNFSEITTGELIDLDSLLQDNNFEGIASILYRPIIKEDRKNNTYLIEEYKGYDDKRFEDGSIRFYLGFINFFYKSYQILKKVSPTSTILN